VALAAAVHHERSTDDLLLAYVVAAEVSARVGMGAAGAFHDVGYHPTGVAGAFGAATAAAKLAGLDASGIAGAQGIVGSMAAGLMEFLEDGSWTKRSHPGWAAAAGLTAAALAGEGWVGPRAVYEGRFGLYATHLAGRTPDLAAVTADLGVRWELGRTAVKPYPTCHFNHAFSDAVLAVLATSGISPKDIDRIRCLIHPVAGKVVGEPLTKKRRPQNDYDAKFSLPYVVATTALRGRFTLEELSDAALADPEVLDLADRVEIGDDPDSVYPEAFSGVVEVVATDGRRFVHRERINRGHESRPLQAAEILDKFEGNVALVADDATAARVKRAVLELGEGHARPARQFAEACRGRASIAAPRPSAATLGR
jgi:2-methylcitrate dehydratase PrpD